MSAIAQQKIQLRSADKAECVKSDMTCLKASFSFSTIEAQDYESERGTFSWLSLPNTVRGGNEGEPQIPVINQLIAVPFGANPIIEITSYSTTDYRLDDYGMKILVPYQPSLRKDKRLEDVPFVMKESAYQTRGLRSEPTAVVNMEGTMRGVRLGMITIEPVSYDPMNNTIRVFNDIEVTVHFNGADAAATEQMLVDTYSPYFDIVYSSLFNGRAITDVYTDHPDLYSTPVKMLVVTTSSYANSTAFQNWLTWKKQKGFEVDIYTVTSSTSSSNIRSGIQSRYNSNHPSFLVIVGDETVVPHYSLWNYGSNYGNGATDLEYASVDGDIYHDMYLSRMPVNSTTQLGYLVDKILMYEKYTMPDPSYLNETLLVAGWDSYWTSRMGKPTINYAINNYFKSSNGITAHSFITTASGQTTCYNYINNVGFVNYTAHGDITEWTDPSFTNSNVNSLINTNKPFWAMGNCCLTANFKNAQNNQTCFGEQMVRVANKGAFCYIGSLPESYWYEDLYFSVGAYNAGISGSTPSITGTSKGAYDALFDETGFNCLNAVPFIGDLAVSYAYSKNYNNSSPECSAEYYWRAYQCFGDGSVMPYLKVPATNNVSHNSTIPAGASSFRVNADAGSYVAITVDNNIIGVAVVPTNATYVDVPLTTTPTADQTTMIVVTRNQRQPYIATIGPNIIVDSFTPNAAHVGDTTNLSITFKNVGTDTSIGTTTITLTSEDPNVTIVNGTGSFDSLAPEATTTVEGFQFRIASDMSDGTNITFHYIVVNDSYTYEGNLVITANEAVLEYQNMVWDGSFVVGETITLTAKFKNTGHYMATNAVATMTSSSNYITISNSPINMDTIAVGAEVSCEFNVIIASNCPQTTMVPVTFTMTADGGLTAQGNETLKNTCSVIFDLADSYGDGWNGASLMVSFDDGTESQSLTFSSGSSANYTLEIGNGTHVTLTWVSGSYDSECSFTVSYEGNLVIYQSNGTPSAGIVYQFDCNCAAISQTYMVNVSSSNPEQGTVSGGGEYSYGQICTVTATPADGYYFMNWTQGGTVVSSTATYSFVVEANVDLVANFAEGIYIGDGGNATNQYLPSYSYYNYSLTQQIYTAEEIGTSGMITSIAFFNGGAEKTRIYDLYMKHTTKSNFSSNTDWITVSPSDMVFSGSVTMVADGWTMIIFDTPFIYDGISNVVLVADDNTGEYSSSPHMACRVFDAEGPQAIYVYQDGTDFNPMSPPTSSTSNNDVLSVKNQIILGLGSASDFYVISATANPAEGGTVTGTGTFAEGATCTLTATPANGYEFLNWNENNQVVSVDAMYSFTVEGNRNLVANFGISIGTVTASYHPDPMNPESPYVMVTWGTNTDSFEAQIGDDTSTFGYFPFHTLYSYSIAENLFLATELVTVGVTTAPMTSLSWYATNTTGYNQEGISIWMANVDDETLTTTSHVVTDMTLVYRGAMTPLVGWNEFVFNQGTFAWDGHSNVLICCQRNNGNWNSSIQWQRHDAGFLAGAFNYTDTGGSYNMETMSYSMYTTTYRANIMFKSSINRENSVTYKVYRTDCDGNNYSLIADNVTSPFVDSLWLQLPVGSYQYGVNYINDEGNESEIVASNCIDRNLYTYQITATPNFEERGTVTGAGTYELGNICTLTATANEGYHFVSWTKNGTIVSVNPMYSFTVMQNAIYVANFSSSVHPGLLEGVFSTSENTQIRFSQGNLQYIGSASTPYWKFADNQWDYFGSAQNGTSSNVDRDLFGFAASGYDHGAVGYQPWSTSTSNDSYYAYGSWEYNLYDQTGQADWGYNAIINGGNQENLWRTPTKDEWVYIFNNRTTISGIRYARAVVNNVNGVILLPDNWNASIFTLNNVNMSSTSYNSNDISATDWTNIFEPAGAVFLPAAGYRNGSSAGGVNENGDYWSSSVYSSSSAYIVNFRPSYLEPEYTAGDGRWYGRAARLVQTCTTSSYTIYIEPNPVEGGSVTGAGTYPEGSLCTLTAIANQGYTFVNWTKDNVEVSTEATYSFTVTENATYVANFILNQGEVTQENTLAQGYNWWSTYIEQEGINGLEMLENSLGGNGVAIRSQASGYTDYYGEDYGWWGSLTSINNESSYRVVASTPCTVTMTGTEAVPSQHPITLNHGWTWMGYVPSTAMDVNTAMAGMEASNGDMLKSQQGYADYYPNYGWYGSLNTIEPGMGLMYYSASGETVTFTYPDNMTVMATIELDGEELNSEHYELAAFANGECRGSVRLTYAEPLHRHVAFLTISGKDAAELSFRLYDTETGLEYYDAEESLDFVTNAIVGMADDLYTIHFRGTTGLDELAGKVQVYPNPVNVGERFSINVADDVKNPVRVEIVNALGVETMRATSVQTPAQLTAPATAGVYTLRITVEGKGTVVRKLVVK